jgi:hypothetical protein
VLPHHVIDPAHVRTPLDALAVLSYALVFACVAVLAQRRPSYAIAALVAVVPFALYRDVGHTTITLSKVALLGAIVGLALRRADVRCVLDPTARGLVIAGLGVIAATALSIAHADFREPALRETLKACEYLTLFATVVVAARADAAQTPVRFAFAASVAVVAVLALAQEFGGAPSGLWYADHAIPRIAGPLEGPNQLAGYLGLALPVVFAYLATRGTALERFAFLAGSAALILTISRAGVATTALAIAIVAAFSPARTRRARAQASHSSHFGAMPRRTRSPASISSAASRRSPKSRSRVPSATAPNSGTRPSSSGARIRSSGSARAISNSNSRARAIRVCERTRTVCTFNRSRKVASSRLRRRSPSSRFRLRASRARRANR